MNKCLSQVTLAMRAGLLALLVLGIVVKPMLTSIFELHSADHLLSVQVHATDLDPSALAAQALSGSDGQPAQDHTQGGHGLMHEGKSGGAYSDAVVALSLPITPYLSTVAPLRKSPPVSSQHMTGPFRPPIA